MNSHEGNLRQKFHSRVSFFCFHSKTHKLNYIQIVVVCMMEKCSTVKLMKAFLHRVGVGVGVGAEFGVCVFV